MTARGAAGRCPSSTWMGSRLLLVCLLVSRSVAEVSEHCSHMIGNGHLQILQQLIDSQMETACLIEYKFVDQEQLDDPVCYLKKAFVLVQVIIEETMRFKDNTPNANATERLQELSMKLNSCFIKDYKEQNEACVQTYKESPLRLLEKIKNFFNETKNFLEKDWNIFSKNCNDSFAKCSSRDVVTKPDCNCLYPKATPSSDLASASPHQPPAPSMAPLADLAWDDSQRTEGSSLLPSDLPLRIEDPGSAKQRPPRSTCQTLESTEQPNHEDPQPHPSAGAPIPGVEDIIESSMGTNWVLEEASGEASEGFLTQERKFSPSNPVGGSIQAETDRPWARSASSPFPKLTEDQQPTNITDTPLTEVNPMRPTGQTLNNTPEKTDGSSTLREDQQEPRSPHFATLNPQRVGNSATPYAKLLPPKSHSWGIVLPLGELEGKKSTRDRRSPAELKGGPASEGAARPVAQSTRDRRSPAELKGGPASEGAARPVARFNSIPLTDTGSSIQDPQTSAFVFWVLGIILVLLAVGGLLFYSWKRRSHRDPRTLDSSVGRPEGSSLAQDEDRQVELPV
ncbi:colony stimulating factor 1 (macrophage), isoform CRA_b [Rattus norvegicus]|uniref:Macrophage colony-stimulating factor 1 n=2 Tax=Rattus norvegicus TaxID=10116 RepID=CSF1_RAT|nr:RecName: Full=Macrophage colony-stimulating factor 1; Short=CSF-1; Short=MCSF; AltName: Full=Proteoglycan macrophage colony-stimulating factor; Short=PG-M-CSF; Contains: RecName: Full=Processed macrophage colony-stimulating factor 1; Contains: RecName: Full=Macrophage colony-stimulating factor 1 43 kDa subunit; Flags: Precursor [Rattus norvegicus]AAM54135.1 macrophage colony stimulating factor [Rattus norvegicus]AAM54136.1 macrophage colony stimulating factor [Rattus norvegicus]AAM94802.1 col